MTNHPGNSHRLLSNFTHQGSYFTLLWVDNSPKSFQGGVINEKTKRHTSAGRTGKIWFLSGKGRWLRKIGFGDSADLASGGTADTQRWKDSVLYDRLKLHIYRCSTIPPGSGRITSPVGICAFAPQNNERSRIMKARSWIISNGFAWRQQCCIGGKKQWKASIRRVQRPSKSLQVRGAPAPPG